MKRQIESDLLSWSTKTTRLPLVLKGARQVGKTYVVKNFAQRNFKNFHEFNFEVTPGLKSIFESDPDPRRILQELSFQQGKQIGEGDLIFLDEIQECPKALTALKYFAENLPRQHVIVAGSLLGVALNEVSYPVGKVEYLWLGPMTFEEFLLGIEDEKGALALRKFYETLQISELEHTHLWEQLKRFYITGGLPKSVAEYGRLQSEPLEAFRVVRNIQENLIRDYTSDFSKHSAPANAVHIRGVFENIPLQLSAVHDGTTKKFKFNEAIPGRKGYAQLQSPIDWLYNAGLSYKISIANRAELPLRSFCKENLFKLFALDVGIFGAQLRLPPEIILKDDYGISKGYFAENLVLQGLIENEKDLPISWMEGQSEVEFLIVKEGEIIPIEVKSGLRTRAKSLASYIKKYRPKAAVKLWGGMPRYERTSKLHSLPLYAAWGLRKMDLLF